MQERGEHGPFVSHRCLTYAAQRLEHIFPTQCPARVSLFRILLGPRSPAFAGTCLAPSPPHPVSRLCSATSQLLQRSPTSPLRASLAYGFRLPNAARSPEGAGRKEISRFPCKECRRVHGVSDHAEPVGGLAMAPVTVLPSRFTHPVGARKCAFAAQYPAHNSPHQRFTADLAVSGARHGAGAAGYAFTVWNLHPLLLAGFSGARAIAFGMSAGFAVSGGLRWG